MSTIRWAWLFLDTPRADAATSWAFWAEVTGTTLAPRRGEDGEFSTLLPSRGGPWVKLQAVTDGPGGVHLDLDVDDVHAEGARAEALGATRVGAIGETVLVLRSPGGFPFCLTTAGADDDHTVDRAGLPTVLDQLCLDIPSSSWETETAFWAALTGWPYRHTDEREFGSLVRPPEVAVRVLLQRLDEERGAVRGHPDFACTDRVGATERHVAAGAAVVHVHDGWTVLTDPLGRVYCLTDRSPQPRAGR